VIAEILGQSERACVYTTKDNHLRWEFFANRGRLPAAAAAVVGKFDRDGIRREPGRFPWLVN
jgi:hypothetical protein